MNYKVIGGVTVAMLVSIGCTSQVDSSEGAPSTEQGDQIFTVTVVHLNGAGQQTVTHSTMTREQELALNASRSAPIGQHYADGSESTSAAITQDGSCAGTDIWIYDGANLTGNLICFDGSGSVLLSSYCDTTFLGHCTGYWNQTMESFWSGAEVGYFFEASCADPSICLRTYEYFTADTQYPSYAPRGYVDLTLTN